MNRLAASFIIVVAALVVASGCLSMTPEERIRNDIFWDAARTCEARYRTLHIDRIDREGNVSLHADAESRHELPAFNNCYRQGIQSDVEAKRRAGITVAEMPSDPSADLD